MHIRTKQGTSGAKFHQDKASVCQNVCVLSNAWQSCGERGALSVSIDRSVIMAQKIAAGNIAVTVEKGRGKTLSDLGYYKSTKQTRTGRKEKQKSL